LAWDFRLLPSLLGEPGAAPAVAPRRRRQSFSDAEPLVDYDGLPQAGPVRPERRHSAAPLELKATPPLPPLASPEFSDALDAKLQICAAECNWSCKTADEAAKQVKTGTLIELLTLVRKPAGLRPADAAKFVAQIERPIFRKVAPVPWDSPGVDEESANADPSWLHLSLHYQILIAMALSPEFASHFGDPAYVRRLVGQFESPDPNERSSLASLVIAIANTRSQLRGAIQTAIFNCLVDYLDRQRSPYAVAPALTVASSFFFNADISDSVPRYYTYILPLLGGLHFELYRTPLCQIVEFFLNIGSQVITGQTIAALVLKFSVASARKRVDFLRLLSHAVQSSVIQPDLVLERLFPLLAECAAISNPKVALAAAEVWEHIDLYFSVREKLRESFPLVYPLLIRAQRESWAPEISTAIAQIIQVFQHVDPAMVRDFSRSPPPARGELVSWGFIARVCARQYEDFDIRAKLMEVQQKLWYARPTVDCIPGKFRTGSKESKSLKKGPMLAAARSGTITCFMPI
jgi:hypothetical protein